MNRQPNTRRTPPPDPRDYDMYAAFRTRERGARTKQRPQQGNTAQPGNSRFYDAYARRAAEEQQIRREQRRKQAEQNQANIARSGRITYGQGLTDNARTQQAQNAGRRANTPTAQGTRIQSSGTESYRYGYHSSYRTSDGRIIDGFDAKGRPIYREAGAAGAGAVIRRTDLPPEAVRNLKPVRRVRVETLADTEAKPFPFLIVGTVIVCTALVMGVLFAFMRLNEYTNALSYKTYQLSSLRNEANGLQAEVVRREDLLSIEQTASEILGMVKVDVLTKKYVSIENEDKTEVVSKLEQTEEKRVSVEIDLDTGKPMSEPDRGNAYIPPTETAEPTTPDTAPDPSDENTTDTEAPTDTAADTQ